MAAIFNNDISSPIVLDDTSKRKTGGKPKSIVWGTYIKFQKDIGMQHVIFVELFGIKALLPLWKTT